MLRRIVNLFLIIVLSSFYISSGFSFQRPNSELYSHIENYFDNIDRISLNFHLTPMTQINEPIIIYNKLIETDTHGSARTRNYRYNGEINIQEAILEYAVYNELTIFKKQFNIKNLFCRKPIALAWDIFDGGVTIDYAKFYDNISIIYSHFMNNVTLYSLKVLKKASLAQNIFYNNFSLYKSSFGKVVYFSGALFKKHVKINKVHFNGGVKLNHTHFGHGAVISNTLIKNIVDLSGSSINGDLVFDHDFLEGTINLENCMLNNGRIILTGIKPLVLGGKIKINLTHTDINKISLRYNNFKLYFSSHTTYHDKLKTYNELLEKFKSEGFTYSYKKLFSEYKHFYYQHHGYYITDFIQKNLWNYGLNNKKALYWLGALVLIFSIINTFLYQTIIEKYHTFRIFSELDISKIKEYNILMKLLYFFPFATIFTLVLFCGGFLRLGVNWSDFSGESFFLLTYFLLINILGLISLIIIASILLK